VQNGLISALPFIGQLIAKVLASISAEQIIKRTSISAKIVAKCSNSMGSLGVVVGLFALSFLDCTHRWLAVTCMVLSVSFIGFYAPGMMTTVV
jgi:hypothetical protein